MQSENYVPGVSGWKINTDTGAFELASETVQVSGSDPKALYTGKRLKKEPKPFIVVDGVTYISQAEVERGSITKARIGDNWTVKTPLLNGRHVATGFGVGIDSQFLVDADRFAIKEPAKAEVGMDTGDAGKVLGRLMSKLSETTLRDAIKDWSPAAPADQVREVIRTEMKPGGLLHRN
jgi:hypothetical protein